MSSLFFAASDTATLLAYLDPGFGSMQLQIAVAALLSASFFVKSSLVQAKGMIGRFLKGPRA